jgi:hypothetical protein
VRLRRTYECQRKLCEDPKMIGAWFELVKNTVNKHSILLGDTYNFDETGFQMGQISASRVVTAIDRPGRPKQVKPTKTGEHQPLESQASNQTLRITASLPSHK